MSAPHLLASGGGEEFEAPGLHIFDWGPLFPDGPSWLDWLTKPVLIVALSALVTVLFAWRAFRSPKLVPKGIQNIGEVGYLFVRDQIARPMIGKDGDKWMGFLFATFFFVLFMNLSGVIPVLQLPAPSHIAFAIVLAITVYVIMLFLSVKHQGLVGYFKNMMFPPGLPKPLYLILAPIELLSNIILRPFTHAVRLFANMFAGHLLLAFFSTVAWWFLVEKLTVLGAGVGVVGFLMTIVMTAFEIFVQSLQAFIFTLLAASYIGGALHPDH
ncbi:F0F1 ATP synthase subunit A [Actinomadura parmotrematis]|uniref:ATP synthase subunit a n=1 Tax=Actinomadura parmotrematis TaxID=2864039 RepID=A0ABS7FU22_9ACTN|nr:F0F1 ATP synthase subunit A [Actinomadura parmotrematis]MBW8483905.1 F0F1 ATP synthase subunit A [Actinomadura parmotrematis]